MERQFCEEAVRIVLQTLQSYRLRQTQGGLQQPVCDQLRDHVDDPDADPGWSPGRPLRKRLHHLLPEAEDLLRIAEGDAPHFRERYGASRPREQLFAEAAERLARGVALASARRELAPPPISEDRGWL